MSARPRLNFFWQQFLISAALILLTFFLLGTCFIAFMYSNRRSEVRQSLTDYAQAVADLSAAYGTTGELEGNWNFQMSLTFAAEAVSSDAVICDPSGRVAVCSCAAVYCQHLGRTLDPDLVAETLENGSAYRRGIIEGIYDDSRYMVALPLTSASTGETLGLVVASTPESDNRELAQQLQLILFYTALPCLLAGLAASMVTAGQQTETLRQMADASRAFAMGDFSVRVQTRAHSRELQELAEALNRMAQSLERSEALRQDFVASVSHELKTPMTTIGGFVDGILDGTIPPEKQRQYLQTVSDEVQRLARLVRSMLEVARLQESQGQAPEKDRFDAVELVSQVLLTYEKRINDKHLDVDAQFPELGVPVLANSDSITRVVNNLLDNAVKFADVGSTLGVGVYTVQDKAYVYVRDTGPTIEPEELSRIFDRFHKADKSRSLDRDGVGLGLYLVNSILSSHGEEITVTSRDRVTEFTFTLTLAG